MSNETRWRGTLDCFKPKCYLTEHYDPLRGDGCPLCARERECKLHYARYYDGGEDE